MTGKSRSVANIQADSLEPIICYTDLPYSHQKKLYQDLFIKRSSAEKIRTISIACYDISNTKDSVKVYSVNLSGRKIRKKKSYHDNINLNKGDSFIVNPLYRRIILGNDGLPAGDYSFYITVQLKNGTIRKRLNHSVDSAVSASSSVRGVFDKVYSDDGSKSFLGISFNRGKKQSKYNNTPFVLSKSSRKIEDAFKAKGFTVSNRSLADKTFADVFCENRYIGYYEVNMNERIDDRIEDRKKQFNSSVSAGVNPGLGHKKPVFSQMKELNKGKESKEVIGNISVTGNIANGQEENSQNENNYYEVTGQMEIPIMGLPVMFEGYYTSQDKERVAKAGYVRLHYDSKQAKSELIDLISGYNNLFHKASSSGNVYENIYGTYLGRVAEEKDKLWSEMVKETGVLNIEKFKADTTGLFEEIVRASNNKLKDTLSKSGSESSGEKLLQEKELASMRYKQAMDRYERIRQLEDKAKHYKTLLADYHKNNYYDSLIAYEKLKKMNNASMEDKSYKQLSKSAGSLLPPGDSKKFISGLTSLDLGIFSKDISSYTLNGQTIKGIDAGYDLGVFETGFTYGRIEYVSRDGFLDKYSGYSGRLSFKPAQGHKTSIIYYGYTPSTRMLNEDAFFKNVDVYMPSFKTNPVNILSVTHTGTVHENVKIAAEVAASYRTFDEFKRYNAKTGDKMSYRLDVEGHVPETGINIQGGYEHVGKQFENNTLPLTLSGTERYTIGSTGQFFKSFLTLGVQYNYLVQQNFASKSVNSKWGFDIKTTSKRYPSASLSYKPFTTFRSYSDTFNLPQRPIFGEVWIGKLSYQIKNKVYVLRLTAIYNKNSALADTVESSSNITQLNAIYTRGKLNLMLNVGQSQLNAGSASHVHGTTSFVTAMVGYMLNSQWNVSAGQDIGTRKTGLSRYGANIGCGYRLKKVPLMIRAGFRYNTYQVNEAQSWKNVYAGLLDVNWQFRFKMKDRI